MKKNNNINAGWDTFKRKKSEPLTKERMFDTLKYYKENGSYEGFKKCMLQYAAKEWMGVINEFEMSEL